MLFIVRQKPKQTYRASLATGLVLVEAKSKSEAVRLAKELFPDFIGDDPNHCIAPEAFEARAGLCWYV